MRIFKALLILVATVVLLLIPLTASLYYLKTDQREDTFTVVTVAGQTAENITFGQLLYEADTTTVYVLSDLSTDVLSWASYNATTNNIFISGLTPNATRELEATYAVDALAGHAAIILLAGVLGWIWLLLIIAFAPAALAAIFMGKD